MLIKVTDPILQTVLFATIFFVLLFISVRKRGKEKYFSKEVTNQLKGLAILTVVFSHIGYSLSESQKFLYPLSVLGGVGVNIFLFLSGFGLTVSQIRSPLAPLPFLKKRLLKIFIPLWIIILGFLLIDFLFLQRTYPVQEIIQSFLGFFPKADIFTNIDSPLWYFSLIFFYYLIFPFLFIKKIPEISPLLILFLSLFILNKFTLPIDKDVLALYKLHFLAFPLGVWFALTIQDLQLNLKPVLKILILIVSILIFSYTAIHSAVGEGLKIEQTISIITTLSAVIAFSLIKFDFKLLAIFGLYSYEMYLLHLPILSRFNLFLSLPPFLMVLLNLILILITSYALQILFSKFKW